MRTQYQETSDESFYSTGKSGKNANRNNAQRNDNKRNGKCNFCHKPGHWARDCFKKKRQNQGQNQNQNKQDQSFVAEGNNSNWSSTSNQGHVRCKNSELFIIEQETCLNAQENDIWFSDSGATEHMSFRRDWFQTIEVQGKQPPRTSWKWTPYAGGRGDILVRVPGPSGSNVTHTLGGVLYIPGIQKNLLSVNKSTKKGITVVFEHGGKTVKYLKNDRLLVSGSIYGKSLYALEFQTVTPCEANEANVIDCSMMNWHERLGHPNFKTLRQMVNESTVLDLRVQGNITEEPFCEGCVLGNQHRFPFPKSGARRITKPGKIFHMGLCGKMSKPSLGGANYFLLLKNDYSRYCFVYFLKKKSDAEIPEAVLHRCKC